MNFLSHYYFDKQALPARVMGTLLPDLIKNAVKEVVKSPLKHPELFKEDPQMLEIWKGWERHVAVDKYFHHTSFFLEHTQALREKLIIVTAETNVRPSFLAHIALELMLDHLLILEGMVNPEHLYGSLLEVPAEDLEKFLTAAEVKSIPEIIGFIQAFTASKYLISYRKRENLTYALNRICMRLWPEGLSKEDQLALDAVINAYLHDNYTRLLAIFSQTDQYLSAG